ncbi:MAG: hypothetical protein ACYCWW_16020 [Deltaproteobacteria bacterium]
MSAGLPLVVVLAMGAVGCFRPTCFHFPNAGLGDDPVYASVVSTLPVIVDGGTADFGGLTLVTTFDGGVRTTTVSLGPGAPPDLTISYPDDWHVQAVGDIDHDGRPDYLYQSSDDGGTTVEVEQFDTNLDGVMDQQNVRVFDKSAGQPYTVTDTRTLFQSPDGGIASSPDAGSWVVGWTFSGTTVANQSGGTASCDGMAGFPSSYDTTGNIDNFPPSQPKSGQLVPVPGTKILILQDVGPGSCSAKGVPIIVAAFEEAIKEAANCLLILNPKVGGLLAVALAQQPLYVACANSCENVVASTDLPPGTFSDFHTWAYSIRGLRGKVQRMSLNPTELASLSTRTDPAGRLAEVLIHELLHYSGINHDPPPAVSPTGLDLVYGAGRYCDLCPAEPLTAGSGGSAAEDAKDCAQIADPARIFTCGSQVDINTTAAPDNPIACTDCTTGYWLHPYPCDPKKPTAAGDPANTATECCAAGGPDCCPAGCSASCQPGWTTAAKFGGTPGAGFDCVGFPAGPLCNGARWANEP